MTDPARLERMIEDARVHGVPALEPGHASRFIERAEARRRRRRAARGLIVASAAAAALVIAWVGWRDPEAPSRAESETPASTETPSNVLRFADGSRATPLDDDTELFVDRMEPDAIDLVLVRGAARFEVTEGLPRAFRVRAGTVVVSVIGTVFTVRREGPGAAVEVDEGRVRIEWSPDQHEEISAGERGVYPIARASSEPPPAQRETVERETERETVEVPPTTEEPRARPSRPTREAEATHADPPAHPPVPRWRALAEAGRHAEGYGLLLADVEVLRSDDVEALMLAADCARLSGHSAESLVYLRRALEVGRNDDRAPIIAFTLGRVLLQQLARPAEAADSFAEARRLAPEGSLAQDALAREVEACHRAGLSARARSRALDYLRLYPNDDLRANAVRHYGGLD